MLKNLECNLALTIRAKREVLEIGFVNLSVRHTDTDKSASILSVSFRRSSLRFDPICDRADN